MNKIVFGALVALLLASCAPTNGTHYDVSSDIYIHNHVTHPVYVHRERPYIIIDDEHGNPHHKKIKNIRYKNGHRK